MKLRIREARIHAGFTQKELADKLGVALTTLSGYETGRSDPKTEYLIPISILCNTTVDFLIGLTDKIEKDPLPRSLQSRRILFLRKMSKMF